VRRCALWPTQRISVPLSVIGIVLLIGMVKKNGIMTGTCLAICEACC
jgi:multidrug efflux pump subunit AcrB